MRLLVAIDPSINSTGVAVFSLDGSPLKSPTPPKPQSTNLWEGNHSNPWKINCRGMATMFECLIDHYTKWNDFKIGCVVCELPQFFDSGKGQVAASTGSLVKLSAVVGSFLAVAQLKLKNVPFKLVNVTTWKGQLPKDVLQRRIEKFYGEKYSRYHFRKDIWDAVGLGLWYLGFL